MNIRIIVPLLLPLLIIGASVLGQSDLRNESSNAAENITRSFELNSVPYSMDLICNQTETCQKYDESYASQYNDLKTRECMCDEKCSTYGDCCEDSVYYNETKDHDTSFTCTKTFFDGHIYMMDKCASNFTDIQVITYCQITDRLELLRNFILSIPVSSISKNITYKNAFCALCNFDLKAEFWQAVMYIEFEEPDIHLLPSNITEHSNESSYTAITLESILPQLKIDENRTVLVSQLGSSSYICNIVPNLPGTLSSAVRFCRPNSNDRVCSYCETKNQTNCKIAEELPQYIFELELKHPNLPRTNVSSICNNMPPNFKDKVLFCRITSELDDIKQCFFSNEVGEECLVNSYFRPGEYTFAENGTVYLNQYKMKFPPDEYTTKTDEPNKIYVCGAQLPTTAEERFFSKLNETLTEILIKFSIFFLILYLMTNANRQKLQSLPNKILFSFCLTLMILYCVFEIGELLPSCKISAVFLHYLFLSCFAWLLIASFDFWQVICLSSTKLQALAGKARLKRYLIYCFLGWISPLSIVSVAVYFELALNKIIPCSWKPGYGRLKQCFISQQKPSLYFFIYPTTAIFSLIIILFAHTSYHIYMSKRKNIKSTAQNNYYILFVKLALSMGLTWTVGLFVTYTEVQFFHIIYVILNSSHGTLIFFIYGFKKSMLTKIHDKHKDANIIQQTKSTFFSITDKIKSSVSPSTSSFDPPTQELDSNT